MAVYQWNEAEYTEMMRSMRKHISPRPLQTVLVLVVAAALSAWLWTVGQYAFVVALWVVVVILGLNNLRLSLWSVRKMFQMNRMAGEVYRVVLSEQTVEIEVARNRLILQAQDLRFVSLNERVARIQHALGVELFIPRDALSSEEEETVKGYQDRLSPTTDR